MIGALVAGITGAGGASLSSYESIATATGTGSSDTITFSSIPSTFKHLQIRGITRNTSASTGANNILIRPNGSATGIYAYHYLQGDGASATASGAASQFSVTVTNAVSNGGNTAGIMAVIILDILDYGSTSNYKTHRLFTGTDRNGAGTVAVQSGLWQSTAAITSIDLISNLGNWATTTTFALYGIKEA